MTSTSTSAGSEGMIGGSYELSRFAVDAEGEILRLKAQVDLFWNQELDLYTRLGLRDGMSVLDCGCGPGTTLEKLCAAYPSLRCVGVEIAPELAAVARDSAGERYRGRLDVLQQSAVAMKLPDNQFDFAVTRLLLEHLPDPLSAVREVLRVLKPSGRAVFIDNDFDLHERTWPDCPSLGELYAAYRKARRSEGGNPCIGRELPGLLREAGFSGVEVHLLSAHNQVIGDAAFLKAEGAGIPAQLVRHGYLAPEALDRIAAEWHSMLCTEGHSIFRMLIAGTGRKPDSNGAVLGVAPSKQESTKRLAPVPVVAPPNASTRGEISESALVASIQKTLAGEMDLDPSAVDPDESLARLGVDSISALALCHNLQTEFGVSMKIAEVLDGRSAQEIARTLAAERDASSRTVSYQKIPSRHSD